MDIATILIGIAFIIGGYLSMFLGGYIGLNEESRGVLWIILLMMGVILSSLGFIVTRFGKDETSN
ncbi:MAG: hypothetical protein ACW964_10025 [Candidatus Hodarchaeales archaeon]